MKAAGPERDAEGFMVIPGFERMPCTAPGCKTRPYTRKGTNSAKVLCHGCSLERSRKKKARRRIRARKRSGRRAA